jgi:iron uptake system component EfeO
MLRSTLGAIVVLIALSASLVACSSERPSRETTITVSVEHCGTGWTAPHPGQQSFLLANHDIVAGEVFLVRALTGAVVAYVDNVAPGATAELHIDLGSGRYQFRCAMADRDVARGGAVVVPGHAAGGATAVTAVTEDQLVPIAKAYQSYVENALPVLRALVVALAADLDADNVSLARVDWLRAHLAYQRLGGAYGAFGQLASQIDGTSAALPNGVDDVGFTGFHRIEYGLWHGQSDQELAPYGTRLVAAVDELAASVAGSRIAPLDVAIRAHEITENALQFDLTGESDYGSGSELASVDAELDGTNELVTLLAPVLQSRYPGLSRARHQLILTKDDVDGFDAGGAWMTPDDLPTANRERINSDMSEVSELLAPIASICEPRRTQ